MGMAALLADIHLEIMASTAAAAASFCSARARWRTKRPRAMVMLSRSVPRITRPARASISVAARADSSARGGEDVLNCCFIVDQGELAAKACEEKPLVEVGADDVESVGGG